MMTMKSSYLSGSLPTDGLDLYNLREKSVRYVVAGITLFFIFRVFLSVPY
ncbi:MAG: hypothetical protein K2X47_04380 [Bdellovibrionales bacterium]|nr:hypothetical protein [Bdellovibrionales bacterium]